MLGMNLIKERLAKSSAPEVTVNVPHALVRRVYGEINCRVIGGKMYKGEFYWRVAALDSRQMNTGVWVHDSEIISYWLVSEVVSVAV